MKDMGIKDDDDFDELPSEIRGEDGMNVSERKLFEAMKKIGLDPIPQYKISQMKVDFAFPDEMIAIEINGPMHDKQEQKITDKKRLYVLHRENWKRRTFSSSSAYNHPDNPYKPLLAP
ncbi:MAG: DUF559 domain-containing protein [Nanoarchaeota archaeon]|nr:MAG: DUF559 domain-containing protein [Nanoarchaeota archaeon]